MIKVINLRKKYGDFEALKGISFEVEKGVIFSFLGPNGAGKTTTIEILEGLRKKTSGEIYFFGKKVEKVGKELKEKIGVLLQRTELFRELTVIETLSLFRSFYEKGYNPEEVLEIVGLEEKKKSRVRNLSGGQFQRLCFGLSIINDPKILFLDEPTTGLDPQARRHIWDLILKFKREGKTIFLTTHYMEEAQNLSDMVCIIDNGKIVAQGSPDELIRNSGLNSIIEIEGEYDFGEVVEGKTIIETSNVMEEINKLLNIGIENFTVRHPTLEDVFLKLTGRGLRD
ncbi:ABC transporter ATP-binding protein [Thermosipho melanesiensis]|uniref:ABC transporter related n=2 Tax=Thermosipho melanesiensis TaxID=46541 RepID=A6LJC7_THEM4|nr:ABC transporter ATP-binding protein [Thermosipho melanesiensis]ABR30028.1 ABC transporter related [Thermosipho melanesiensis BI429]APT73229.1 ABC transporter ATP-binding protein [Thermosipho melanesiensis]